MTRARSPRSGMAVLRDGSFGHEDDIVWQNATSLGVRPDDAWGVDADIVLPRREAARGWRAEWKHDYFGVFHATHSNSGGA